MKINKKRFDGLCKVIASLHSCYGWDEGQLAFGVCRYLGYEKIEITDDDLKSDVKLIETIVQDAEEWDCSVTGNTSDLQSDNPSSTLGNSN